MGDKEQKRGDESIGRQESHAHGRCTTQGRRVYQEVVKSEEGEDEQESIGRVQEREDRGGKEGNV